MPSFDHNFEVFIEGIGNLTNFQGFLVSMATMCNYTHMYFTTLNII